MHTVAESFLAAVGRTGTSTVFGLPGVHNLAFWGNPTSVDLPKIVKVRHEQTAVYGADGFARCTGKLGVALVTTGPGAANCVAAFGEAAMARSPVLLVASEVATRTRVAGLARSLHESADQASMFRSLAKSVWSPRTPDEAGYALSHAISDALAHPRGPVYVDVPTDVLWQPTPVAPPSPPPVQLVEDAVLERVATTIEGAARIGIWAGGGVVEAGAENTVAALAERLHAPIFTTFASRGLGGPDSPVRVPLPPHEPAIGKFLASLDLLLALGSDFDGMLTKNASLHLPSAIIDVNLLAGERSFGYQGVEPVQGDVRRVAEWLLATIPARTEGPSDELPEVVTEARANLENDPRLATARAFVSAIQRVAADVVVVNDMCIPGYWLGSYFHPDTIRCLQYPVGWGTLGYALPAAVGAGAARSRRVLAVCGDAGVLFAVGELATIKEQDLPVTVLIVDDDGYGMLRFDQVHAGRSPEAMGLRSPDFENLVRAFGLPVSVIPGDSEEAIAETVGAALRAEGPNVVVWRASLFPPRTTSPRWDESPTTAA